MLTAHWLNLISLWLPIFSQQRTFTRAVRLGIGFVCRLGRGTITHAIVSINAHQTDWSGFYKIFSRAPWKVQELWTAIMLFCFKLYEPEVIAIALDDTKIPKTGKKNRSVSMFRDPLSPKFHPNLIYAQRFLQASLLLPFYNLFPTMAQVARAVPIRFVDAPTVKKPGKRATPEEIKAYKEARKQHNLSTVCVEQINEIRTQVDELGYSSTPIVFTGDGSMCNKTLFTRLVTSVLTILLVRCRKDAVLCFKHEGGGRRFYGETKFTPEQVRTDESIPWNTATVYYGWEFRTIRYKELMNVLWQGGAQKKFLRLFVIAPTRYQLRKNDRWLYRDPAYLLCTSCDLSAQRLIQIYCDRWQIEVNHRDEKTIFRVGEAQVWSEKSVGRVPAFQVALYSCLLVASFKAFGIERGDHYGPGTKWWKGSKRPSLNDMIRLIRHEIIENPELVRKFGVDFDHDALLLSAGD